MSLSRSEVLDRAFLLADELEGSIGNAAASYGLTVPRMELLFVLGQVGESKQRDLAAHLRVSPRQVTALVDAMVESGYLARHTPDDDRRVRLVSLTEAGQRIVDEVVEVRAELAAWVFQDCDDDELAAFAAVSERVIERVGGLPVTRFGGEGGSG